MKPGDFVNRRQSDKKYIILDEAFRDGQTVFTLASICEEPEEAPTVIEEVEDNLSLWRKR